jgi:hypothetical protein
MSKQGWLAGLGIIGACAICCLPLIITGASAIGLSSIFVDLKWVFIIAAVVIPVVLILIKENQRVVAPHVELMVNVIVNKKTKSGFLFCRNPAFRVTVV